MTTIGTAQLRITSGKTASQFEQEHREEVRTLLAALSPHDIAHFQQMSDADLIARIRSLETPFQSAGALERVGRLLELLQYSTEKREPKTRTEYEYMALRLECREYKGERLWYGFAGLLFGALLTLASVAFRY